MLQWTNLEGLHLYEVPRIKTERVVFTKGRGMGSLFNGYRVSLWDDEKVLEVVTVMNAP